MYNKKINVGLVFGGNSSEHEISIQSAKNIYNAVMGFPKNHPIMENCIRMSLKHIEEETFKNFGRFLTFHNLLPFQD